MGALICWIRTLVSKWRRRRCSHPYPVILETLRQSPWVSQNGFRFRDGVPVMVEVEICVKVVRRGCPGCGMVWIETQEWMREKI